MITQSDFNNWKQDEVTKTVYEAIAGAILDADKMAGEGLAITDLNYINWLRGYTHACKGIINHTFEDYAND